MAGNIPPNYPPPNYPPPYPPPEAPPPKRTSPWVWVLVGCGSLVVVGIIIVVIGGFFAWNKMKEAGINPELMEKQPALATAKLITAMNPEIELVSVDEEKGLITVKEKKTGKLLTVDLQEAQKGRIVFKGEGEEELTIEAQGDESTGTIKLKSREGSLTIGGGTAQTFPDWFPSYPGVTAQGSFSADTQEGQAGSFQFVTQDSIEKVIRFYDERLKRAGFKVTTNLVQQNTKVSVGTAVGEDEGKKRNAVINAIASDKGTEVTIMLAVKR
jgi:hypothetical protein